MKLKNYIYYKTILNLFNLNKFESNYIIYIFIQANNIKNKKIKRYSQFIN